MSPSVSLRGVVPLPVASAPSTSSSTCQAEYNSQNVHLPQLDSAQDCTVPSFLPITNASANAKANDGIAYSQPRMHAGPYIQPAIRSDDPDLNQETNFAGGSMEAGEGTLHSATSASPDLDDIVVQDGPSIQPQRSPNPMRSTMTLRSYRNKSASTKQASAPKRAVIHDARTSPGTHIVQTGNLHKDPPADAPQCDDEGRKQADLPERSKPGQDRKTLTERLKALETRIRDPGEKKLIKEIIKRQRKPDLDMTATKGCRTTDSATMTKRFPCPSCNKIKDSASELK